MRITNGNGFTNLETVKEIKVVTSIVSYGVGLLTSIVKGICAIIGCRCEMYEAKIRKAQSEAVNEIIKKAESVNANAIVNLRIQIDGTTVEVYGLAVELKYKDVQ